MNGTERGVARDIPAYNSVRCAARQSALTDVPISRINCCRTFLAYPVDGGKHLSPMDFCPYLTLPLTLTVCVEPRSSALDPADDICCPRPGCEKRQMSTDGTDRRTPDRKAHIDRALHTIREVSTSVAPMTAKRYVPSVSYGDLY